MICPKKGGGPVYEYMHARAIYNVLTQDRTFIQTISIAPLQVHFYSEALPTQHGYCDTASEFHAEAPTTMS